MSRRLYRPIPLEILDQRDPDANCRWLDKNREEPRDGEQINVPNVTMEREEAQEWRKGWLRVRDEMAIAWMALVGFFWRMGQHRDTLLEYRATRIRELKEEINELKSLIGSRGYYP